MGRIKRVRPYPAARSDPKQVRISVIIPVYNKFKYLNRCLESLTRQSVKDLEIIVVDDGSKENAKCKMQNARLLKTGTVGQAKLQFKIQNLRIFRQEHKGTGTARNLGVKKAQGKILVFVDSDMTFDKEFVKNLIKPISAGKTKGTFSREEYVANWRNKWAKLWNYNLGLKNKRKIPANYPDKAPVFRAILKSEFLKAGGFDSSGYADDWSLSKKLGFKATVASGAVYYHYNPEDLREVFTQAKWRAKRKYKWGIIGELANIIKFSLPISLIRGIIGIFKSGQYEYLIFRIIFDCGSFVGLGEKMIFKDYY